MSGSVRMVDPATSEPYDVPDEQVTRRIQDGWHVESSGEEDARIKQEVNAEAYGGVGGAFQAGALNLISGATGGLSDMALRAAVPGAAEGLRNLEEQNPAISMAGQIGGTALGAWATGGSNLAAGIGERAAARLGGGALAKIGGAAVVGGIEGAVAGAGQGVHELALSEDPITLERAASVIGSNALLGGLTGGGVGAAAKGVGLGLGRARKALDAVADRAAVTVEHTEVAAELKAFREDLRQQKIWLATKGSEDAEVRAMTKRSLKADKALDNLLDDPRALAENPKSALRSLRIQEAAYDDVVKKSDDLRKVFAGDATDVRMKALDAFPAALERNRSLQAKIGQIVKAGETAGPKSLAGEAWDAMGHGTMAWAAHAIPVVGPVLSVAMGAQAAIKTGARILGKLGGAVTESQARRLRAVGALLDTTGKIVARTPTPVASKVLTSVRYADREPDKPAPSAKGKKAPKQKVFGPSIDEAFHVRSAEIRSQVTSDPMTGKAVMRPEARAEVAKRLAPIAAHSPLLADHIETVQARKVEYLADKLRELAPHPDYGSVSLGPDNWRPSDMAIREWARHVAAVEDPDAAFERVAAGKVTPEDAEAIKAVYPEQLAEFIHSVVLGLGQLKKPLPFQRRLALSIFTGLPIDPSMNPDILAGLQEAFTTEPGTDGGTHAPVAQSQFGSVKSVDKATPAQARAG